MIETKTGSGPLGGPAGGDDWQKELDQAAERELLLLGEGQLAYLRPISVPAENERPAGSIAGNGSEEAHQDAIGVFSAAGNLVAVCPDMENAAAFAYQNNLVLVARH